MFGQDAGYALAGLVPSIFLHLFMYHSDKNGAEQRIRLIGCTPHPPRSVDDE